MDPVTGEPHIYNHQVGEDEVEDVLTNSPEDGRGREDTWVAIGRTASGRCLKVLYKKGADADSTFAITAFELTGKPLAAFRRRQRKKQQ